MGEYKMVCRNCGKEISNSVGFCKYCGTKLQSSTKRESLAKENTSSNIQENREFSGYTNYSRNRPEIRGLQIHNSLNNISTSNIISISSTNADKVLKHLAMIDRDTKTTKLTLKPILCVGYDSYKRFSRCYLVTREENDGLGSSMALREIEQFRELGIASNYIKCMSKLKVVYREITETGLEEYIDNLIKDRNSIYGIVTAISFILITEDIFQALVKYNII
jgi:hypothetical protein